MFDGSELGLLQAGFNRMTAGLRERDFRNGVKELLAGHPFAALPFVWQFLARPRWLAAFLPSLPRDGRGDWLAPGVVTDPADVYPRSSNLA